MLERVWIFLSILIHIPNRKVIREVYCCNRLGLCL